MFLTNHFDLPALTITRTVPVALAGGTVLQMDQATPAHQAFFGTSENAVKTQVWIAIAVYVLVAVVKKRLKIDASLYTILQILSLTLFEKTPLDQLLARIDREDESVENGNQLNLFT